MESRTADWCRGPKPLGILGGHRLVVLTKGHLDDLGEVKGVAARFLSDLFTATEAVGNDQSFRAGNAGRPSNSPIAA